MTAREVFHHGYLISQLHLRDQLEKFSEEEKSTLHFCAESTSFGLRLTGHGSCKKRDKRA